MEATENPKSSPAEGRYRCRFCGSEDVEATAWVGLNDEAISSWEETPDYWCPECSEHHRNVCFVTAAETCRYHERPFQECLEEASLEGKEILS